MQRIHLCSRRETPYAGRRVRSKDTHQVRRHCSASMMTDCQRWLGCTRVLLPSRAMVREASQEAKRRADKQLRMRAGPFPTRMAARRGRTCDMLPSCPISAMLGNPPASPSAAILLLASTCFSHSYSGLIFQRSQEALVNLQKCVEDIHGGDVFVLLKSHRTCTRKRTALCLRAKNDRKRDVCIVVTTATACTPACTTFPTFRNH